jgi:transcriptional regulator with XRE-family HTH domain
VTQRLKERRKQLGVSLDELAAALGSGFSRARLSVAERGLIELSEVEHEALLAAIERIGKLRSEVRNVVERAQRVNLAALCDDIRLRVRQFSEKSKLYIGREHAEAGGEQ